MVSVDTWVISRQSSDLEHQKPEYTYGMSHWRHTIRVKKHILRVNGDILRIKGNKGRIKGE